MPLFKPRKPVPEDGQMELLEHLAELRTRIFRSLLYVIVGMVLTYNLYPQIYALIAYPLQPIMEKTGGRLMFQSIQGGFLLRMQVCLVSGLAASLPFITYELWGFVAPALTPEERKPVRYLAPFSVLLFLAGLVTGYASLPAAYGWMSGYINDVPGATLMQNAQEYILLTVKIVLAFGIAFQLPMILLFLARIGLITASLMTTYWRHAVVGISVTAAVLTPSNDPLTMLMMAIPMAGLYLLSIGLVRAFEPREDGTRSFSLLPMLLVSLAPAAILVAAGFWLYRGTIIRPAKTQTTTVTTPAGVSNTPVGNKPASTDEITALQQEIQRLKQRLDALEAHQPK